MEFDYVVNGSIWVSEDDLNEMAEEVKNGRRIEYVVDEYVAMLDDCDFYNSSAFEDKIIVEVRKRAREL